MAQSSERLEINNLREEAKYLLIDNNTLQHENKHLQEKLKTTKEEADKNQKEKEKRIQYLCQQNCELQKKLSKAEEDRCPYEEALKELTTRREEISLLKKLNQEKCDNIKELKSENEEMLAKYHNCEDVCKRKIEEKRILRNELQEKENELQKALDRIQELERHVHAQPSDSHV